MKNIEYKCDIRKRAAAVAHELSLIYPDFKTLLQWWSDPFKLLIAVSLSAQTTDKSVNAITPKLWKKYPSTEDLANANMQELEQILKPIGFYKNKAKNTVACAKMIDETYNKTVPQTMNELIKLPGVGRKTANVVLNVAFNKSQGIAVDTHVFRMCTKLGLTQAKTPQSAEKDLMEVFDKKYWKNINNHMVRFGRETCSAINPKCHECKLAKLCPTYQSCLDKAH